MEIKHPENAQELKRFLDVYVKKYNTPDFISTDPISIPHRFVEKRDREIAGFFAATLAWGQRVTILKNADRLMQGMGNEPYRFITEHRPTDLKPFTQFVHRTFNGDDCLGFIHALREVYRNYPDMEALFYEGLQQRGDMMGAISHVKEVFFRTEHLPRTRKHLSDPETGSAAKRINMFLRWMVREDHAGVDFGCWKNISPSVLICPLDVHSGRTARKLGLLTRTQDDRKAAEELTGSLRLLNPKDPVQYDFALYGLGVFEKFS